MPAYTEPEIRELCKRLMSLKTEEDLQPVLKQLRKALREHVRLARNSLEAQAAVLQSLEGACKQHHQKRKAPPAK